MLARLLQHYSGLWEILHIRWRVDLNWCLKLKVTALTVCKQYTVNVFRWCPTYRRGHISISEFSWAKLKWLVYVPVYLLFLSFSFSFFSFFCIFSTLSWLFIYMTYFNDIFNQKLQATMIHLTMSPNTCPNLAELFCWLATRLAI